MAAMTLLDETGVVDLARDLVRAESPTGRESPAAEVLEAALRQLGYDQVRRDEAGNVVAELVRGEGPTVMLNGHIDTVPAGDPDEWPHPPFAGVLDGGVLWGRGACDMKGAVAAMAIGGRLAAERMVAGRIVMSGVVQEEVGGLGARHLAGVSSADVVIVGEPSNLDIMLGHRGRIEVHASFPGAIAHAAKAQLGRNALARAARFVTAMEGLDLPEAPRLGRSSATPTQLRTFPVDGANVVPDRAELTIDYRNVPGDDREAVLERLRALDPGAAFDVPLEPFRSEDGRVEMQLRRENPAHLLDEAHPVVGTARRALEAVLGRAVEVGAWWFATDAPHLAAMGAPVFGFGPGDPELAHTSREHVTVEQLIDGARGYRAVVEALLGGRP
jgi:succinyl-diaminopimelate desuccinylase